MAVQGLGNSGSRFWLCISFCKGELGSSQGCAERLDTMACYFWGFNFMLFISQP